MSPTCSVHGGAARHLSRRYAEMEASIAVNNRAHAALPAMTVGSRVLFFAEEFPLHGALGEVICERDFALTVKFDNGDTSTWRRSFFKPIPHVAPEPLSAFCGAV